MTASERWKAYLTGGAIGLVLVLFWAYLLLTLEISTEKYSRVKRMAQQSPRITAYVEKTMKEEGVIRMWQYLLMKKTAKEERKQAARDSVKDSIGQSVKDDVGEKSGN